MEKRTADVDEVDIGLLFSPSEVYHENSKIRPDDFSLFAWIHEINSSPAIRQVITQPPAQYHGFPEFDLPTEFKPTDYSFEDVLMRRRSIRTFSGRSLAIESLAKILFLSAGVTGKQVDPDGSVWHLRAAPSGGGLYPIDVYVVSLRVEGLPEGLYFYAPLAHRLQQVSAENFSSQLAEITNLPQSVGQACVVIILCARFLRSKFKYGERAYRFVLLEAGHIAQNILLVAQAEGLGGVAIGGFVDDSLNRMLQVDGVRDAAIYMILLGHPQ